MTTCWFSPGFVSPPQEDSETEAANDNQQHSYETASNDSCVRTTAGHFRCFCKDRVDA